MKGSEEEVEGSEEEVEGSEEGNNEMRAQRWARGRGM